MARAPRIVYEPSRPLTAAFLALLVPACLWGLALAGLAGLGALLGIWSASLGVFLLCGLAVAGPLPFVLRGVRTAMIPLVVGLLFSFVLVFQDTPSDGGNAAELLRLSLAGLYCVTLSWLFRRARPLLAALDKGLFPPSWLMGLAVLPVNAAGFGPAFKGLATVGLAMAALVLAGALPGLLWPRFRALCAWIGLGCATAGLAWTARPMLRRPAMEEGGPETLGPASAADAACMLLALLLLAAALWLDWKQRRGRSAL